MVRRESSLFYFCTSLLGVYCQEFRGDLNYHTETPSPPTLMSMAGPTHVLVHINPNIHKNYAQKIVDYYDKPALPDFTAFCRCWRSKRFPYCDGGHHDYNKMIGDNAGPIIIRRRNVTGAESYYRRMRRLSINFSDAGTPVMCSQSLHPSTASPKVRRPFVDEQVDVDAMMNEYGAAVYNFTKYLDDFIHMEKRITPYVQPVTEPTTTAEPTLWFPTYRWKRFVREERRS